MATTPILQIVAYLQYTAEKYSHMVALIEIGKSFENRPLYVLKVCFSWLENL